MTPVLELNDLRVSVPVDHMEPGAGTREAVRGVSLTLAPGESLGVVGESGSGKSLTMLATLGLLPAGVGVTGGAVVLNGRDITDLESGAMGAIRGRTAAMIFQDPMSALNPLHDVGAQVAAAVRVHAPGLSRRQAWERGLDLLTSVGVRDAAQRARTRPHEWSGGMRQRAMIAMAIAHDPMLLIADEPTTALDVTVQAQVMDLLAEVRERTGSAMVLITHDLGLVAQNTERIAVMYGGEVVETGESARVLHDPQHAYTRRLLASRPEAATPHRPTPFKGRPEVLVVDKAVVEYPGRGRRGPVRAVDEVSLSVRQGETVAVVGESGCGKSSLARAILGIFPTGSGSVSFGGRVVDPLLDRRPVGVRELTQIVFQDPYSALDPRLTVQELVAEPLRIRRRRSGERVRQLLADVGLDETFDKRHPSQLSGGQRQRVGIARALALRPSLLVLDEPVSALDVSIQAQVLDLLNTLQTEHGLGYLFISHDLGVVRNIADRVVVMRAGKVVEDAPTEQVFARPQHAYTQMLLDAVPRIDGPRRRVHHTEIAS